MTEVLRFSHTLGSSTHSSEDIELLMQSGYGMEIKRIKCLFYSDPGAQLALFGLMKQSGKILDTAAHAEEDALYLKLVGGSEEPKEEFEKGELVLIGDIHVSCENYDATTPDMIIEIHYNAVKLSAKQMEQALDLLTA